MNVQLAADAPNATSPDSIRDRLETHRNFVRAMLVQARNNPVSRSYWEGQRDALDKMLAMLGVQQ